jgi:hypothetical protein
MQINPIWAGVAVLAAMTLVWLIGYAMGVYAVQCRTGREGGVAMRSYCKHCGGTGWLGKYEQCPWCDGTGGDHA